MKRRDLGRLKEDEAVAFLERLGYKILDRNFTSRFGEIDIVALDNDTVVFIEVRSRSYVDFGFAQETVDRKKIERIIKTAGVYIVKNNIRNLCMRFDVISFNRGKIEHIKDAFNLDF